MWKEKPALFAAAVMAGGFAAGRFTGQSLGVWALLTGMCCLLAVIVFIRRRSFSAQSPVFSFSIPVFLFFASALWYSISLEFESNHITQFLRLGRPMHVYCRVAEEPVVRKGKTSVIVGLAALAGKTDSTAVIGNAVLTVVEDRTKQQGINARDTLNFSYGDMISFTAVPEEPQETRNPGEVSYRDYLALNNVYAVMRVKSFHAITVIGDRRQPDWFYEHVIFPSKHFVTQAIRSTAQGDEANYLTGLLLGDRSDLSKEIQQAFANTGTVHVLAVSGSHVAVIVAAIYALFGILRIPPRAKIAATIGAIWYYMLLTGASPSVVRASLMGMVVLAGKLFQRRSSVYNCLGVSAILMFLYDPKQVFDVGFQLSFAAVFSMVCCYPRMTAWTTVIPKSSLPGRIATAAVELTALSAAAQIGTVPFTAYYFEKVSLVSLVANLFVVPLAELNIALGFVSVFFSVISLWIGSCFTEVNCILTSLVLGIVKASNQVPYAIVHTASFGAKETVIYIIAVMLMFNITRPPVFRKLFLLLFFIADCLLVSNAASPDSRLLRVTFFDVGQGDAALIEFPGTQPMMIDAGPRSADYDAGEKILVPGLRRLGIHALSTVLVTHPHDDHIGGIPALLSGIETERMVEASALSADAVARGHPTLRMPRYIRQVQKGDTLQISPDARLYVLHPSLEVSAGDSADLYSALNNSSIVVRLCYGTVSFLFMGDAERKVEDDLVSRYGAFLKSTVIKLGHHGSSTSSSEDLLRAVDPAEAVISVGRFNAFHHPSPGTLRRLLHLGIPMHRTDRDGALIFETDGRTLHRIEWREDARMRGIIR
jgi:competence protein ComEC